MRHFVQLLFQAGRGSEALEFYSQIPAVGQLTGDLGRMATQIALANRDFRQAEEIARKAVEANPEDFQARLWLVQVLMEERTPGRRRGRAPQGGRRRQGRSRSLDHPGPVRGADPPAREGREGRPGGRGPHRRQAPLALAQCCEMVGKAYEAVDPDRAKTWYGQARGWFAKAQAGAEGPR